MKKLLITFLSTSLLISSINCGFGDSFGGSFFGATTANILTSPSRTVVVEKRRYSDEDDSGSSRKVRRLEDQIEELKAENRELKEENRDLRQEIKTLKKI